MSEPKGVIQRSGKSSDRTKANGVLKAVGALQGEYKQCSSSVRKAEGVLSIEEQRLSQAEESLRKKTEALSEVQEVIDADYLPEGAQPVQRIQKRDSLLMDISQSKADVAAQSQVVQNARQTLRDSENAMFLADQKLSKFVREVEDATVALKIQGDLDKERASRLASAEKRRAKLRQKENAESLAARAAQFEELERLAQTQVAVARKNNKAANDTVKGTTAKTRAVVERLEQFDKEEWKDRADAVLELRTNQVAVRSKAATQSEKYNRKIQKQKKELEEQKESMLAKGLNPYAEFRKREIDLADEKKEKSLKNAVERNKAALSERLIKEESDLRKAEMADRREKAFEKKHRDNLGPHIIEERNRQYLMKMTTDNVEILDPTGRAARVDASKITDIPDNAFGLGPKSTRIPPATMKRITNNIRKKLKVDEDELGEYSRLVRSSSANASSSTAKGGATGTSMEDTQYAAFEELAATQGEMPGVKGPAATINLPEEKDFEDLLDIASDDNKGQSTLINSEMTDTSKYKITKLTKLEQDFFESAKGRQKARIQEGVQQVAGGKVFKGQAFVSHPQTIDFIDFEVGRVYKKKFTLTNTSYTFNTFKLLPLADNVVDFFEISFEKPGRMSAGVSCSIDIKFSPQLNEDIDSVIPFYSETGPFEIPLKCCIRRCIPEISTPAIEFGRVVVGQQVKLPVKLKNIAAKSTAFTIRPVQGGGPDENSGSLSRNNSLPSGIEEHPDSEGSSNHQDEEEPASSEEELNSRVQRRLQDAVRRKLLETPDALSITLTEGIVDGYGNATVMVLCAPLSVGEARQRFEITFHNVDEKENSVDSSGAPVKKKQFFEATCITEELPIYLTNELVDLKCTLYSRIYRKRFELRNRSTTSCPVAIKIPSPLSKYIEVNPTSVNVQVGSSISINVKFVPERDILEKLAYYSKVHEEYESAARFMIPVEIQIVGQELPIFFIIQTDVTTSNLHLTEKSLDFGKVYVSQQKTMQLAVKNPCMLPQKIAFINLKKEIKVQPNDGFFVLLPNESTTFDVSMCPMSAVPYDMKLQLTTSSNDNYEIKAKGIGMESPIVLDNPVIHMLPTTPGEKIIDSAFVSNTSKSRQCFEVVQAPRRFTWLKISPTVVDLEPGERCRLEIEYLPPRDIVEYDPLKWHKETLDAESSNDSHNKIASPFIDFSDEDGWVTGKGLLGSFQWTKPERSSEECDAGVSEDEWGYIGKFHFPIYTKPPTMSTISNESRDTLLKQLPPPLYLNLETVIIKPEFIADVDKIDFGQMAVGTTVVKTIKVRNLGHSRVIHLKTSGLNAVGPFSVINAARVMPPSQWHTILVECSPGHQGLYVEHLDIESADGGPHINVSLRVQGVNPVVELSGLDPHPSWSPSGGILDFGDVTPQSEVVKKFVIRNKSLFTISARIERTLVADTPASKQAECIQRTISGLPLFSCRPEAVDVAEGEEVEVDVVFRADRSRLFPFREDFNVLVGKGEDPIKICAVGHCRSRQLFVRAVDPFDEPFFRDILQDERDEDVLFTHASPVVRAKAVESSSLLQAGLPAPPVLQLDFPDPYASSLGEGEGGSDGDISQSRSFLVCSAAVTSTAEEPGKGSAKGGSKSNGGEFEYKLSEEAVSSRLFSVSMEKGSVAAGADATVTVTCTLKRPRGLGGLEVGSWQKFQSSLTLKGGWKLEGDEDDVTVPIVLNAYIRL